MVRTCYGATPVLEEVFGDLLTANCEALVNAVNTVGMMSQGVSLTFKQKYPDNFDAYRRACDAGELTPGRMFIFDRAPHKPRWIINFPTKQHWSDPSRVENIHAGLLDLVEQIRVRGIRSVAVPALGCGMGGLSWPEVRPMIADAFYNSTDVHVMLYPPRGAR
jgi:O-acetyl-ADP-ribose deacetylase (regulator of RNase III)